MLAARFLGIGKGLDLLDVPVPTPGPGEALVKVAACGVCASDLHMMDGTLPVRTPPPVIPGHESAGIVASVGPHADGWKVGDRVAVYAGKRCGQCPACQAGRDVEQCAAPLTMGVDFDGAWAEYTVAPVSNLVRVPDAVPLEIAALLTDCVATPFNAVTEVGAIRPGESVAIFGVGGLGTHAVQIARMSGASFVAAVDPRPGARARAVARGADLAVDPANGKASNAIRAATGGLGVDLAVECVGANEVLKQAVASLAPRGRCVVVGVSGERISLGPSITFAFFQSQLRGAYGYARRHLEALLRLVESGRLDVSESISQRLPLEQAAEGVAILEEKRGDPIRVLLVPPAAPA